MRSPDASSTAALLPRHLLFPLPYLLLTLAHITLVWLLPWFPTQDGPSHVYNVHILADLLEGGRVWGRYYEEHLSFVPNLGFTLVTLPLLKVASPLVAERIFLTVYVLLTVTAVPLFIKALSQEPFPAAYLVFPVIFNFTLMMGFYSYAQAVPLFLLALAAAWRLRDSVWWLKALLFNGMALVIYVCHFIPFVMYLMGTCLIPLAGNRSPRERLLALSGAVLLLTPSATLGVWYLSKGEGGLLSSYELLTALARIPALLTELLTFSTLSLSRLQMIPTALLMGYVLFTLQARRTQKTAPWSDGERFVLAFSGTLCAVYLLAPFRLGEGSYFNDRFPWVILLVLAPVLSPANRLSRVVLLTTACASIAVNAGAFVGESKKLDTFMSGLDKGCSRGDFIMTYRRLDRTWVRVDVLRHAASYYGVLKGCIDIGNYEAGFSCFFVQFRPKLSQLPKAAQIEYEPWNIDLKKYPELDCILGWKLNSEDLQRLSASHTNIFSKNELLIFKPKEARQQPHEIIQPI